MPAVIAERTAGVPKRARFIINPTARTLPSPDRLATGPAWLRLRGWEVDECWTRMPGHAEWLARESAECGYDAVIVVGGDGTVREAVSGLSGSRTALAVVAAGTANVWAREVRLPRHPAAVARLVDHGAARAVDVGVCNGHRFLLMASLGVDSAVVATLSPWAKRLFGRAAYIAHGFREAATFAPLQARVSIDGDAVTGPLLMAVVGNTRSYGGLIKVTNHAVADDGLLDLMLYTGRGFGRFLVYLARTVVGRHTGVPGTLYRTGQVITVETEHPVPVQADGDVLTHTPVAFTVEPRALRVIVPPGLHSPIFSQPPLADGGLP
jgi:YegS/Rv2252/BmrU family lipid kinase